MSGENSGPRIRPESGCAMLYCLTANWLCLFRPGRWINSVRRRALWSRMPQGMAIVSAWGCFTRRVRVTDVHGIAIPGLSFEPTFYILINRPVLMARNAPTQGIQSISYSGRRSQLLTTPPRIVSGADVWGGALAAVVPAGAGTSLEAPCAQSP